MLFQLIILCFFGKSEQSVSKWPKQEGRVVGGEIAPVGEFPFAAAITIQTAEGRFFCTGAFAKRQWIITSANCVNNAVLLTIRLGSNTLDGSDAHVLATSDYFLHENFNPDSFEGDLALIKLRIPLIETDYIQSIAIQTVPMDDYATMLIVGWGHTSDSDTDLSNHLRFGNVTVLPNPICKMYYGNQVIESMACVKGNYNEGTCLGDTGGPLFRYFFTSPAIAGVASFVSGNGCESTNPSGYTRIEPYLPWIDQHVQKNSN